MRFNILWHPYFLPRNIGQTKCKEIKTELKKKKKKSFSRRFAWRRERPVDPWSSKASSVIKKFSRKTQNFVLDSQWFHIYIYRNYTLINAKEKKIKEKVNTWYVGWRRGKFNEKEEEKQHETYVLRLHCSFFFLFSFE